MLFTIDKNVPIPPSVREGSPASFLSQMVKGDSVLITNKPRVGNWLAAAKRLNIKITSRKEGSGIRVWHNGAFKQAISPKFVEGSEVHLD